MVGQLASSSIQPARVVGVCFEFGLRFFIFYNLVFLFSFLGRNVSAVVSDRNMAKQTILPFLVAANKEYN